MGAPRQSPHPPKYFRTFDSDRRDRHPASEVNNINAAMPSQEEIARRKVGSLIFCP